MRQHNRIHVLLLVAFLLAVSCQPEGNTPQKNPDTLDLPDTLGIDSTGLSQAAPDTLAWKDDGIGKGPARYSNCETYHNEALFKKGFYPFTFGDYSTQKMLRKLRGTIQVDSIGNDQSHQNSGVYTFSDGVSTFTLYVKSMKDGYCYLRGADIRSNMLRSDNGIRIGMRQDSVFDLLTLAHSDCDTFLIKEGDFASYHYLIFRGGKLAQVYSPDVSD